MNNYQRQQLLRQADPKFSIKCDRCGASRPLGDPPSWMDIKAFFTLHQKLHSEKEVS